MPVSSLPGRLLAACLPLVLAACASSSPGVAPGSAAALAARTDALAQTHWELARWTRPGGTLRPVPHPTSSSRPITLEFTREHGRPVLSGHAGCNRYSGTYTMANGLLVVPQAPMTTRMACADAEAMQRERDYLAALTDIRASRLDGVPGPQRLTLALGSGDVLEFGRRADPVVGGQQGATKLVYVAARQAPCGTGAIRSRCYQVRDDVSQPWQLWHGDILGFAYQPGIEYRLRVVEQRDPQPQAGAPEVRWILDAVIEQRVQTP
ncbi:DUF4377 domain-containing protein [Bordetella sp. 2513F-2]